MIVVDDGSTDGTDAVLAAAREALPELRVVHHERNPRQKGAAVRTGMLAATGQWRVFMDADLSTPVADIDRLLSTANEQDADVAIGSIAVHGASIDSRQWVSRTVLGTLGSFVIRLAVLPGINDTQRGIKLFSAQATEDVFKLARSDGWGFDVEALALAHRAGLRHHGGGRPLVALRRRHGAGPGVRPNLDRGREHQPASQDTHRGLGRGGQTSAPPLTSATLCLPAEIHGIMPRSSSPTFSIGCSAPCVAAARGRLAAAAALGDPLLGERAVLDLVEDASHLRLGLGVDDPRARGDVAVLGGVGDRVAHARDALLVHEVDDQLQLVQALEVRRLGLVARLDERLEAGLHERR